MITEILISEVEIIRMLMPSSARAVNILLATPACERIPTPTIDTDVLTENLDAGRVIVVAGFQGFDANGNTTTLGRGGSDTSGVALAAALKADECQIYTDVDGVYTTDPCCTKSEKS
jgi:aspartate kinase